MWHRLWQTKLDAEQQSAKRTQENILEESEMKMDTLRRQLNSKYSEELEQQQTMLKTVRREQDLISSEMDNSSRELKRQIKEQSGELEKREHELKGAENALRQLEITRQKVAKFYFTILRPQVSKLSCRSHWSNFTILLFHIGLQPNKTRDSWSVRLVHFVKELFVSIFESRFKTSHSPIAIQLTVIYLCCLLHIRYCTSTFFGYWDGSFKVLDPASLSVFELVKLSFARLELQHIYKSCSIEQTLSIPSISRSSIGMDVCTDLKTDMLSSSTLLQSLVLAFLLIMADHVQERIDIEGACKQKIDAAQTESLKVKEATEKKVSSVIDRLHQLTEREAKRENQRGEHYHIPLSTHYNHVINHSWRSVHWIGQAISCVFLICLADTK